MSEPRTQETPGIPGQRPGDLTAVIAAEGRGQSFLVWRDEAGEQRILDLLQERRYEVGRTKRADVPLPWDIEVSRAHARLESAAGGWIVEDLDSLNGSFVNGSRVSKRHRLHDRDRMCFGRTHVLYREPRSDGEVSTARAPGQGGDVPLTPTQRSILVVLCRPMAESPLAPPASNTAIAEELHMSVDAVKAQLRELYRRFGLDDLKQIEKRTRLAGIVLLEGVLQPSDL
jgi:hypothetical protein